MPTALIILLLILQVLDAWTTSRILAQGGTELNPVMRWLFARMGIWASMAITKGILMVLVILLPVPVALLATIVVAYGGVVAWNWNQLLHMRGTE